MRKQLLRFEEHVTGRRGREGEVDHSIDVHGLHLKNNAIDRHAKDFGFAELVEVVFKHGGGVEAITMSRTSSSGTTCTLRGGSFRDPAHLESLNAIVQIIPSLRKWVRLAPCFDT